MTPVPDQARIVVLGEAVALERLEAALPGDVRACFALLATDDLLLEYDDCTRAGEALRRDLERLYASLRGRLLVRLLVVDLNPESVSALGHCALERAAEQWGVIESRLVRFLDERAHEGMEFVTVVIVEQGDLHGSHREFLERLASAAAEVPAQGSSRKPGGAPLPKASKRKAAGGGPKEREDAGPSPRSSPLPRQIRRRAYLMTRLLELGERSLLFARDIWPEVTGGLLRHFLWGLRTDERPEGGDRVRMRQFLESEGLFAWRTTRIVAAAGEAEHFKESARIFASLNRELLDRDDRGGGLLPELLPPRTTVPDSFSSPLGNALSGGAWHRLRAAAAAKGMAEDSAWEVATAAYGSAHRLAAARSAEGKAAGAAMSGHADGGVASPDLEAVRARRRAAEDQPGLLFAESGSEEEGDSAAIARAAIDAVRDAKRAAAKARAVVEEWSREHDLAARAFAVAHERIVVGVAVSMALFYPIAALFWLAGRHLPGVAESAWKTGLILGGFVTAGVATMLAIGWALQRWRGRRAALALAAAGGRWLQSEENVRQAAAASLITGAALGEWSGRALARELLRHRLRRAELILQNELQLPPPDPGGEPGRSRVAGGAAPAGAASDLALARRLLEAEFDAGTAAGLEEGERERIVATLKEKFLQEWRGLLRIDADALGFLPVAPLLDLCERHVRRSREEVWGALRETRVRRILSEPAAIDGLRRKMAENGDYLDGGANFFSVNISGGAPLDTVYHRHGLSEAFRRRNIERLVELPAETLGKGVLGVWYGECRLRILDGGGADPETVLTFESATGIGTAPFPD